MAGLELPGNFGTSLDMDDYPSDRRAEGNSASQRLVNRMIAEVNYWASPACLMKVRRFNEVLENSRF